MALETSPAAPAPVRQIALAISGWVDRLGPVWVEGQMAQISRRPGLGTVFIPPRRLIWVTWPSTHTAPSRSIH